MTRITNVANPRYGDADGKQIVVDCDLVLQLDVFGSEQTIRTTTGALDGDAPSQQLYDDLKAGKFGAIAAFVPKT